ncbi:TetR/AcrR family transcriptional regulator [Streptomyces hydrogenans]|uniref:TetR/AcrR family transcriptional regulator n=1 Tax=Streptomyces hydrogenans TaxID=1873719 RepID=UPI00278BF286|nr:TetR/AcrR family transcriptional regulator [Streptomyces hydrogenans]
MTSRQSGTDVEGKGPGRPRDERMTGLVLDAVVDLVAERGMGELTMSAVAARAGVSKPAIYRRWPTKQDLVIAAAESRVGVLTVPDVGNFRDELRELLAERLRQYRTPGVDRLLAGVIGSAAEADAERSAYGSYTSRVTGETRRVLERGIDRGDVRPDTDVAAAATLVAGSLLFRMLAEQDLPDAGLVDAVVDMVARAVGQEV